MSCEKLIRDQLEQRGWITNFWTNMWKKGKDKVTFGVLTHRQKVLETYWSAFVERHQLIMPEPDAQKSDYVTKNYFSEVEDSYFEIAGKLCDALRPLSSSSTLNENSMIPQQETSSSSSKLVALVKMQIPIFDGDWLN